MHNSVYTVKNHKIIQFKSMNCVICDYISIKLGIWIYNIYILYMVHQMVISTMKKYKVGRGDKKTGVEGWNFKYIMEKFTEKVMYERRHSEGAEGIRWIWRQRAFQDLSLDLVLSLPICMTLDKLLNGPILQFLYLKIVIPVVY